MPKLFGILSNMHGNLLFRSLSLFWAITSICLEFLFKHMLKRFWIKALGMCGVLSSS
jgi:hypothetical protein